MTDEPKEMTVNWQQRMVMTMNALMRRSELISSLLDPRRKLNHECGYPETNEINTTVLREMFERDAVGARVVEVWPSESWAVEPEVYEDEDMGVETEFEAALKELSKSLRGEESLYEGEEGNPLWEALLRVDILSGVGSYGVLLLGTDDGEKDLALPLAPKAGRKLLYLREFDEALAQISTYENDPKSVRYGWPDYYMLTFADPSDHAGQGQGLQQRRVHWSRVLHVADNLVSSEMFGVPRCRPVWNHLLNLQKLYGGSAEMYWRGAFPGISLETIPQLGADVELDTAAIREQMEQYMNGLQRYFSLAGMNAKSLAPQVVDPTPQIESQLDAICVKLACPKRIFMGSERGELASSQDQKAWDKRVQRREKRYITPRLIVPFMNRLIWLGILPKPKQYYVEWPNLTEADPVAQADIALKRTQAMVAYVGGGADVLMEPQNYLTKEMGFTDDEAEEIGEATAGHVDDGGIAEPLDEREEEMADLDVEAKKKTIEQIGKPQPIPKGGKPNAFGKP